MLCILVIIINKRKVMLGNHSSLEIGGSLVVCNYIPDKCQKDMSKTLCASRS